MNAISSRITALGAALGAMLLGGCQQVYFRTLNVGIPSADRQSVVFDPEHQLSLDVYRPKQTDSRTPVVVFFYGGSWRDGNRGFYRFVGEALSRRGVLVVIPDYRKAPADVFPAFMEDAAKATAWARANASKWGGDPSRVYLMGHSAGAHIAALLGTDPTYLEQWRIKPRDLAGVIGLAGPYDFLPFTDPKIQEVFGSEKNWPKSQPVNFVDGDEPPFLLLHGSSDKRVWQMNSEHLAARLQAAGEPVTLRIIANTGHIGLLNGFLSPRFSPVLEESLNWMRSTAPPGQAASASLSN